MSRELDLRWTAKKTEMEAVDQRCDDCYDGVRKIRTAEHCPEKWLRRGDLSTRTRSESSRGEKWAVTSKELRIPCLRRGRSQNSRPSPLRGDVEERLDGPCRTGTSRGGGR